MIRDRTRIVHKVLFHGTAPASCTRTGKESHDNVSGDIETCMIGAQCE